METVTVIKALVNNFLFKFQVCVEEQGSLKLNDMGWAMLQHKTILFKTSIQQNNFGCDVYRKLEFSFMISLIPWKIDDIVRRDCVLKCGKICHKCSYQGRLPHFSKSSFFKP